MLKAIVKIIFFFPFNILNLLATIYSKVLKIFYPNLISVWHTLILNQNRNIYKIISHYSTRNIQHLFKVKTPNLTTTTRAKTFSSKEPDTLEWIDSFIGDFVFYDIGANIGLYSLYASSINKSSLTYSFEPSFFNLIQLVENIKLNNFYENIIVFSNPLFSKEKISTFIQSNPNAGEAHSSFEVNYGDNGLKLNEKLKYQTFGISIDTLVDKKIIKLPNYIKIDVDGIEEFILEGAKKTLMSKECRSVLIEVNVKLFDQNKKVMQIMKSCGFKLSKNINIGDKRNINISNQIWIR